MLTNAAEAKARMIVAKRMVTEGIVKSKDVEGKLRFLGSESLLR